MIYYDIIVVGGGLVGCAFALDLSQRNPGFKIALLEQNEYIAPDLTISDSRIYAISPENVIYLKGLGVLLNTTVSGTIKTMDVSGDTNGNIFLESNSTQQLYLAKTIESNKLQHQLYLKLQDTLNIEFIYDQLSKVVTTADHVDLIGQEKNYRARLIVGADGSNSFVRTQAEIKFEKIDYQCSAIVANFACEKPHNNTAFQWFKDKSVLAYLPLAKNNISIVWASDKYQELLAISDVELATCVAEATGNKLGKLEVITKAVAFPLRLYLLDKVYAHRVVLIGDAAHTIHPLAGQGVNLGFGDAQLLAQRLSTCKNYQLGDLAVLAKYNALRLTKVRQMQLTCHGLQKLFIQDSLLLKQVRNLGLNLINALPIVKKYLIKKAITY